MRGKLPSSSEGPRGSLRLAKGPACQSHLSHTVQNESPHTQPGESCRLMDTLRTWGGWAQRLERGPGRGKIVHPLASHPMKFLGLKWGCSSKRLAVPPASIAYHSIVFLLKKPMVLPRILFPSSKHRQDPILTQSLLHCPKSQSF